jgi:hypothetical protein
MTQLFSIYGSDKNRNRVNLRNARAKCHISAFDRANLIMTNLIWTKPYTDFYRKGKTVVYYIHSLILNTRAHLRGGEGGIRSLMTRIFFLI